MKERLTKRNSDGSIVISECRYDKIARKLADYEDLEEQGRLIVPPCKVGDKIYQIDGVRIYESTIYEITYTTNKVIYCTENICFDEMAIGHSIFLTREEAEQELEKRKEDEGK